MIKSIGQAFLIFCFFFNQVSASSFLDVQLEVSNISKVGGYFYISVVSNESDYIDLIRSTEPVNVVKQSFYQYSFLASSAPTQSIRLSRIRPDRYGIVVFHDLNDNASLDSHFFGPNEPYGFSQNPNIFFAPPSFETIQVSINQNQRTFEVVLN